MRVTRFIGLIVVIAASSAAASDWPQFGGPDRDAVSPEKGFPTTWPTAGPKELWKQTLNDGFGNAAVQGGKVYLLDRDAETGDTLLCYDLSSGKPEWQYSYKAAGTWDYPGSRSTPAVDDKYVFTVGPTGIVNCIDKSTHKPVWTRSLTDDFGTRRPGWAIAQSPLLYKDWIILNPQSQSTGVVALEKSSGNVVWKSRPVGEIHYGSPRVVTIGGVEQVITSGQWTAGVDVKNGDVLWINKEHKDGLVVASAAYCGDGLVCVTSGYGGGTSMIKVEKSGDTFTAKRLWNIKPGSHVHTPIVYKDHLYILCNTLSKNDGLVCVDFAGNIQWQTKENPSFDKGGMVLADDKLYMLDGSTGNLAMIDPSPEKYKEIARAKKVMKGGNAWAPLVIADGKLLARDQTQIKCFALK